MKGLKYLTGIVGMAGLIGCTSTYGQIEGLDGLEVNGQITEVHGKNNKELLDELRRDIRDICESNSQLYDYFEDQVNKETKKAGKPLSKEGKKAMNELESALKEDCSGQFNTPSNHLETCVQKLEGYRHLTDVYISQGCGIMDDSSSNCKLLDRERTGIREAIRDECSELKGNPSYLQTPWTYGDKE